MKLASLNELKKELSVLSASQVQEICLRLVKYKKENKELINYLLFEAQDEQLFIEKIKEEVDEQFQELAKDNLYLVNKSLRKILRIVNRYIKYSGSKQTETELLIYFCLKLKKSGIRLHKSTSLMNLYQQQLKRIDKATSKLHEDLQFDYRLELERLSS